MLGLAPSALLAAVIVWAVGLKTCRYVSLSSILAGWTLPLAVTVHAWHHGRWNMPLVTLALLIAVLVTHRHRSNLSRIAAGTEPKIGSPKSRPQHPPDGPR